MRKDAKLIAKGDMRVALGWALHLPPAGIVIFGALTLGTMPLWMVFLASYFATALLKVRTFLEHRGHETICACTVLIEGRRLWAFLSLNNSFHVVHHLHPQMPWYGLPTLYRSRTDHFLAKNDGCIFKSCIDIF